MEWLLPQRYVPYQRVIEFMLTLKHVGSEQDAVNILRHMSRLTALDSRVRGKNSEYYVTDYGSSLLAGYRKRNPPEPYTPEGVGGGGPKPDEEGED